MNGIGFAEVKMMIENVKWERVQRNKEQRNGGRYGGNGRNHLNERMNE